MQAPATGENETSRQQALDALALVYTPAEASLDRITALAREMFEVPSALVSLVTEDIQWFKSTQGTRLSETSREVSFCAHAILNDETFVVADASSDPRFADNPLVTEDPSIRFYAGEPIQHEGHTLGTLCILDDRPRQFSRAQQESLRSLARWVEREISVISMRERERDLQAQLVTARRESMLDALTQTWNRRGFVEMVARESERTFRANLASGLMLVDVDHFKALNDERGHLAGDEALRAMAQRIRGAIRPADILGRYGGDEFVIYLAGCEPYQLDEIAERILGRVLGEPLLAAPRYIGSVTIGCATLLPGATFTMEAMVSEADAALYVAKEAGRGCWHIHGSDLTVSARTPV